MSDKRRVLIKFSHGIGDATQFTSVLKHIREARPNWSVDVVAGRGKHSAFRGLCANTYFEGQARPDDSTYDEVKCVGWYENYNGYTDRPNSKITNSLQEEFGIPYNPALGGYTIKYTEGERVRAREWLARVGCKQRLNDTRFQAVGLHYEGNTSTDKKNLEHYQARAVCEAVTGVGGKVILFDWDRRSPLPDGIDVINPGVGPGDLWGNFGSGDAGMIAALIDQLAGFVGIDSGPGKIASSTETATVIAWTKHNPLQFHDPAPHTLHVVPEGYEGQVPIGGNRERLAYLLRNYHLKSYKPNELAFTLCYHAKGFITGDYAPMASEDGLVRHGPFWVRRDNFDQDLVIVQDVFFGDCYRTSLYDLGLWTNVVDIGGHIGTFPTLVHTRNPNAKIVVVEACPENIAALRANVAEFATVIHGACTYEPGELALLNAVRPGCESTGGSVVVSRESMSDPNHPLRQVGYQYWADLRPLRKVSLREAMDAAGMKWIDCLKLDCEGAEYSILENAPEVAHHVRFVFGEYHDHARWEAMRARLFADWGYGVMHECPEGRGLFHLVNPRFDPTKPLPNPTTVGAAQKSEPQAEIAVDRGNVNYEMHKPLARLTRALFGTDGKPVIVETGVKLGGSALSFFDACPQAKVIGFDSYETDPTAKQDREHMRAALAERIASGSFVHREENTNLVSEYPKCDLFFVDGDHTFGGAIYDLVKAGAASEIVVVDDYYPDSTEQTVTAAVNWYVLISPHPWKMTVIKCSEAGRYLAVLNRTGKEFGPELGSKWGGTLKIASVAGLGDVAWIATKLPAILERLGATGCDVWTCESDRANQYLEKLPFVRRVSTCALRIIESERPVLANGVYNYAPPQPNWHNRFHFFLQANGHLENGLRLENWLAPQLPCDFSAPVNFVDTIDDANFAREFAARGPFVTFFAGPLDGNTLAGHNRGGKWTPGDWTKVARDLIDSGIRVVLVGYGPGDQDYAIKALYPSGFFDRGAEDCVNLWELPRTLAVLRQSAGHVGYQSGLGVISTYFRKPCVMFWNEYGFPLNDKGATFREEMSGAWVPLESGAAHAPGVAGKNYFGAIYGRTDASTVSEFIVRRVLEEKGKTDVK